eukprot:g19221.t1
MDSSGYGGRTLEEALKELCVRRPGLGYRAYHALLKEELGNVSLKKVQAALQCLREASAPSLASAAGPPEEKWPPAECGLHLVELPGRGKGYLAMRRFRRGEVLFQDVAFCSALVGEGDMEELATQCEGRPLEEVMDLTYGAETPELHGILQNNVFHCTREVDCCALFLREEAAEATLSPCANTDSALKEIEEINDFMRSPAAAQSDTRQLLAKLCAVDQRRRAENVEGGCAVVTLLNNLSNLHFFCAQNLTGTARAEALEAFYDCKKEQMLRYEALHGGAAQRDISYLLALQRLLSLEPGPPQELRPGDATVLLDEPDIRFCICYDEESPVFIACLWARLKGFDIQEVERSLCQERGEWDKGGESRLLQQITLEDGRREEVYHTLIRCPRPFWDRDVLKHQWRLPLDCQHGQGYALVSRSLEDEQLQPDSERVRAFVHKAGALIRPAREVPPRAELPEDESDSEPIANASIGTELTSCSQIDMGGLIPAWATSYLSSVVAGKALSWTEDLRQHCAERHRTDTCKERLRRLGQVVRHHPSRAMEEDVPSLAEISEFLMPGWTDHWDDTELVEEEFDKELSQGSMGSLLHFFSGESPRKSRSRSPI